MELFGIRIRFHPTFIWLLVLVYFFSGAQALEWLIVVFGIVVLHELSHSLVARAHGIHVEDITLLPIGGVASLSDMPEHSSTEFLIAAAGPAFNFVLAGLLYWLISSGILPEHKMAIMRAPWRIMRVETQYPSWWSMMLTANLYLGIFNLLPAFPMDGGRILRALLARKWDYLRATHIAVTVGRVIAALMFAASIYTLLLPDMHWQWGLLVIAIFVYISGKREEMAVTLRHAPGMVWKLLGFGPDPTDPRFRVMSPGAPPPPQGPKYPDAIDVEGHVTPAPEKDAADAFRQLADEANSRLNK